MFALPLVGWGMLSAAGYPDRALRRLAAAADPAARRHALRRLRTAHTVLAFLLFLTFLAHLGAALLHGLVFRDGVLQSMLPWRLRADAGTKLPSGP